MLAPYLAKFGSFRDLKYTIRVEAYMSLPKSCQARPVRGEFVHSQWSRHFASSSLVGAKPIVAHFACPMHSSPPLRLFHFVTCLEVLYLRATSDTSRGLVDPITR